MPLPVWPDDTWGKSKYEEDVERWREDMMRVSMMDLTREKLKCYNNIIELIAESEAVLKNSGKRLSNKNKQRLYELWQSR